MDCMIDIETLGIRPGAVVLSAAAVLFHPSNAAPHGSYNKQAEVRFSLFEQIAAGCSVEPDTAAWWQNPERAPATMQLLAAPEQSVANGLRMLAAVISQATGSVWAQGASFDFSILGALYDRSGVPRPWKFWMERDTRTAYHMASMSGGFDRKALDQQREGVHHGASHDCVHQIRVLQAAFAAAKGPGYVNSSD